MKNFIIYGLVLMFVILFINDINAERNYNSKYNYRAADSMEACMVTGEEFPAGNGVKYQYLNKTVTFCCKICIKAFNREPANYIKEGLHCPVCSEDDAKKDLALTHNEVKYYFCGNSCMAKFEKTPQQFLNNYEK